MHMVFIRPQRWHTQAGRTRSDLLVPGVWCNPLSPFWFFVADSALDDFVLTHCVFIPNAQLCPVLMAQYPFSAVLYISTFLYSLPLLLLLLFNRCAPTMPRPRRAPSRRSWTTRSTTSAGWSAWCCSGLQCMETTCRRRTSPWPSWKSVLTYEHHYKHC